MQVSQNSEVDFSTLNTGMRGWNKILGACHEIFGPVLVAGRKFSERFNLQG